MAETRRRRDCELCDGEAAVYCPSDSAFLCRSCDSKVHSANFLVARHLRSPLCSNCGIADSCRFSGVRIASSAANLCRSCSPEAKSSAGEGENEIVDPLSSSSSCISSTTDTGDDAASETVKERRRVRRESGGKAVAVAVDKRVEGVLVNWSRRMEVDERRVVPAAVEFLGGCMSELTVPPFRVCLTGSFWVALRVCCSSSATCQNMRRLEQISGVPAKLVLATQSRLARVLKRRRADHEEGWAEC